MFVEAVYIETGERCYLNMDYVVDIFPVIAQPHLIDADYIAYTLDTERKGYGISKSDFEAILTEG